MAKEKTPKPVVRKCHNCGKPLDEGKDFCLHCGETYQVVAKKKKPFNTKLFIKLLIIFVVVALLATATIIIVNRIREDMNESRYVRLVNYIKDNGISTTLADMKAGKIEDGEEESEESEEEDEDEENSSSVKKTSAESSTEDQAESTESTEGEGEGEELDPETAPIHLLKLNDGTWLYCYDTDSNVFYLCRDVITNEYKDSKDGPVVSGVFHIRIDIRIDENSPTSAPWTASLSYDSKDYYQSYDFHREYDGVLNPAEFTYKDGTLVPNKLADSEWVNPFTSIKESYAELIGARLEMKVEDIISSMNGACYELDKNSQITPLLLDAMEKLELVLENEEIDTDEKLIAEVDKVIDEFNTAYNELFADDGVETDTDEGEVAEELSIGKILLMASTTTDEEEEENTEDEDTEGENTEGEGTEGEEEADPVVLPPSEQILRAAVITLSEQTQFATEALYNYLDKNAKEVRVTVGEVGFKKYQEYIDSLVTVKS